MPVSGAADVADGRERRAVSLVKLRQHFVGNDHIPRDVKNIVAQKQTVLDFELGLVHSSLTESAAHMNVTTPKGT